ncbi:MAG: hypothetical protein AB7E95_10475 [Kiritimatiellales bacterium]
MIFTLSGGDGYTAHISVNTTNVVRTVDQSIGINLDYLVDNDTTIPRQTSLSLALSDLEVGTLRFPMGEISDRYLFEYDTVNQEDISRCAIEGALKPFQYTNYVDQATGRFPKAMTTDGFIDLIQQLNAVPFFVVGIDAILKDRSCGQTDRTEVEEYWQDYVAASRAEVYAAASNWVAHVKDLGVTGAYWEIGNENYLDHSEVGGWVPEKYAEVVNDLSAVIKSVDPSAKVGCNGGTSYQSDWWDRVLPLVEDSIDFMVVHTYMRQMFFEYTNYVNSTSSLTYVYDYAEQELNATVSSANRDRIKICVTEASSYIPNGYTRPNALGKALMNFNVIGDLLQKPEMSYLHFWTTRYLDGNVFSGKKWTDLYRDCAGLDNDNNILPMGQALQLWTAFSDDWILETQDDRNSVVSYASSSSSDHALTVYILNRGSSKEKAIVTLEGFSGESSNTCRLFSGTDPDDTEPTLESCGSVALSNNTFSIWLMPYSVTVVEFEPVSSQEDSL